MHHLLCSVKEGSSFIRLEGRYRVRTEVFVDGEGVGINQLTTKNVSIDGFQVEEFVSRDHMRDFVGGDEGGGHKEGGENVSGS